MPQGHFVYQNVLEALTLLGFCRLWGGSLGGMLGRKGPQGSGVHLTFLPFLAAQSGKPWGENGSWV